MRKEYSYFKVIDSHTEGEPTRFVYEGFPNLGGGSLAQQRQCFEEKYDDLRKALILEPRGHDVLVGALLCKPVNPKATAGVIFFNNAGYLGMCGHGTIGLIASLFYLNKITVGEHLIETPVGDVSCTLQENGLVSVRNVVSYCYQKNVPLTIKGIGTIYGDIAYGGNWFFLVNDHQQLLQTSNIEQLTQFACLIKKALKEQGITAENGMPIDHIELFAPSQKANSKNFVLCPGNAYDRSPCGTGTSAKLACLAQDGLLQEGQQWAQESIVGSQFLASYEKNPVGRGIIPTIAGKAYVYAQSHLVIDPEDPFRFGVG